MCQLEQKFSDVVVCLEELHQELAISQADDCLGVATTWLRADQALQTLKAELNRAFQRPVACRVATNFFEVWRKTRTSELTQFVIQEFAGIVIIVQVVSSERDLTLDEAEDLENNLQIVFVSTKNIFGNMSLAQA